MTKKNTKALNKALQMKVLCDNSWYYKKWGDRVVCQIWTSLPELMSHDSLDDFLELLDYLDKTKHGKWVFQSSSSYMKIGYRFQHHLLYR